jgi:hypothetical protein
MAVCAQLICRVRVDYARTRRYQKRGDATQALPVEAAFEITPAPFET